MTNDILKYLLEIEENYEISNTILQILDVPHRKGLEIEMRIGQIIDTFMDERIDIKAMHPVVLKNLPSSLNFQSGVPKEVYDGLYLRVENAFIKMHEASKKQAPLNNNSAVKKTKENTENSEIKDLDLRKNFLKEFGYENEINDTVLIHKAGRTVYRGKEIVENIQKIRLATYNVHFPDKAYDVRISISEEKEVPYVLHKIGNKQDVKTRERFRKRISVKDYFFDFTMVKTDKKVNYEVEVEVSTPNYIKTDFLNILMNWV